MFCPANLKLFIIQLYNFRYIYGCKKEFYDASFAVEIYKFAHQMQIDNLVSDVGKFFYDVSPDKLIPVYNLFSLTNNEKGLDNCRIVSTNIS
jgi:hypothetical protein